MKKHQFTTPILLALLAQTLHCDVNNYDPAPQPPPRPGRCTLNDDLRWPPDEPLESKQVCNFIDNPNDPKVDPALCSCEVVDDDLRDNLLYAQETSKVDELTAGCKTDVEYMWPACSFAAETSGQVRRVGKGTASGDHDSAMDLCPIKDTMFVHPFDFGPMEIRAGESFLSSLSGPGNDTYGRIHLEVQDCHYYDGAYLVSFTELGAGWSNNSFQARPETGDFVSAAGDWLTDDGNDIEHVGHTELHEARIIAKVASNANKSESLLFASGFFTKGTLQDNLLHLDVFVPPADPQVPILDKLNCEPIESLHQSPLCETKPGVSVRPVVPFNNKFCQIEVKRDPEVRAAHEFGCWKICDPEEPAFLQRPIQYCDNVDFTGVVHAFWTDPADLWMCQCPCDDPSAPGATIAAPVQGCAQMGLDPSKPEDQQIACAQVCAGQICGAAPACRIGECHAPASGGTAQLIARGVCDPALPQPIARVSASGDYHVTLDRNSSSIEYHIGEETVTSTLDGTLHINLNQSGGIGIVDFADSRLFPDDFTVLGASVTNSTVVASSRVLGQFGNATTFQIPALAGSFGAHGIIKGKPRGNSLLNPQALMGQTDISTRQFSIDIVAEDADAEEEPASVTAHIVGVIDNVPPVAVSGGPTRTVECTSPTLTPVTLNGSQSFDPDPGDSISHYQWFTAAGLGIGNHAVVSTNLPLGHSAFALHVYDADLGSAAAPLDVNVVDSIAPTLTITPPSSCMWPPDHKRIRFRIGTDVTATATDACDSAPSVRIVDVTSSQPDNFPGDGNTLNDASYTDHAFCIRRERTPQLGERLYFITVEARDANGNTTTKVLPIRVAANNSSGGSCPSIGTVITEDAPCE